MQFLGLQSLLSRAEFRPGQQDYNLDSIRRVMQGLGNPQDQIKAIHVTGTNGKGSTSAMIASILGAAGYRVALFSSPHLSQINERLRIDGFSIDNERLNKGLESVVIVEAQLNLELSFFELMIAASFLISKEEGVDFAVVEVGLGGRLDASNIIKSPMACAITTIGLEHTAILGDTIEKIAAEKGGIIKENRPCYVGHLEPPALKVINEICSHKKSKLIQTSSKKPVNFSLALLGQHQFANAQLAVSITRDLGISEDSISHGLQQVHWPARLETLHYRDSIEIILDSAHNCQGFQALKSYLHERDLCGITMLTAFLTSADWPKMFAEIAEHISKVIVIEVDSWRAESSAKVAAYIHDTHAIEAINHGNNFQAAIDHLSSENSAVLIAGSMYMVGPIREMLMSEMGVGEKPVWLRRVRSDPLSDQ